MTTPNFLDPYAGNILTQGLGPLRSPEDYSRLLTYLPRLPPDMNGIPAHVALHLLMEVRDLHIPSLETRRICESGDLMLRSFYRYRDPAQAITWSLLSGETCLLPQPSIPCFGASIGGWSGTGKTEAATRWLKLYPQVIPHETFPRMVGSHLQVPWLSAEVPASGRLADLVMALMRSFDAATGLGRFTKTLERASRNGMKMLDEWLQVVSSHFLGVLHLDEVQNFFQLPTLEARRKKKNADDIPQLSIVEDQCLKSILGLMNSGRFALIVSGTPDGISALMRRMSNAERIAMSGYHMLRPFDDHTSKSYNDYFLGTLGKYQYVKNKIPVDENLAKLILDRTGGVQRLIIALWIAAHRVALERDDSRLLLSDFQMAADRFLAPVTPAIRALQTRDPKQISRYEDLLPIDRSFWPQFWGSVSSPV